jgi:hypothetical protein
VAVACDSRNTAAAKLDDHTPAERHEKLAALCRDLDMRRGAQRNGCRFA